jgi:hypothetical protein
MAQALPRSYFPDAVAIRQMALAAARPVQTLFSRLYDSMMLARQRQASRDIDRLVSARGRMTDSLERDISNILLGDNWSRHR